MMKEYSLLSKHMEIYERELQEKLDLSPAAPWPDEERTPERRDKRVKAALKSFAVFDRMYFPSEMYSQGYSEPGKFHKELDRISDLPGVHVVLGSRKCGKTATLKKKFVFKALRGDIRLAGTMSQFLPVAQQILDDVYNLIANNARIMEDFRVEFEKANEDQIRFKVRVPGRKPHTCQIRPFSEGRSVRGFASTFLRPEFILCDDFETRQSPIGADHTEKRGAIVAEAKSSLTDNGTLVVLGNNFDEQTLFNRLVKEQEQGILPKGWNVYQWPAWDKKKGSIWPERYPAHSEAEMRAMMEPASEEEWDGDFQQRPKKPEGHIFKRAFYQEYDKLPDDARGIVWTDPNLAKKGLGDTTAIIALLYSPEENAFYIADAICQSYDDSNKLLDATLSLKNKRIFRLGFDGNVSQESTWTNNIRNWSKINNRPFPHVEYERYKVDLLAKNAQGFWTTYKYFFPKGFGKTEQGERFLNQLFAFRGKVANGKDDAPDALISATEFINSTGVVKVKRKQTNMPVISVTDNYSI